MCFLSRLQVATLVKTMVVPCAALRLEWGWTLRRRWTPGHSCMELDGCFVVRVIPSYPTLRYITVPYPIVSYLTPPYSTLPYAALPYPTWSYPTLCYPTLYCPTLHYAILPYTALPYPTLLYTILHFDTGDWAHGFRHAKWLLCHWTTPLSYSRKSLAWPSVELRATAWIVCITVMGAMGVYGQTLWLC